MTKGIDYQMPKKMFDELLKTRTESEKRLNPYQFVMGIINEQFGIKGTVTHLTLTLS